MAPNWFFHWAWIFKSTTGVTWSQRESKLLWLLSTCKCTSQKHIPSVQGAAASKDKCKAEVPGTAAPGFNAKLSTDVSRPTELLTPASHYSCRANWLNLLARINHADASAVFLPLNKLNANPCLEANCFLCCRCATSDCKWRDVNALHL